MLLLALLGGDGGGGDGRVRRLLLLARRLPGPWAEKCGKSVGNGQKTTPCWNRPFGATITLSKEAIAIGLSLF